MQIFGQNWLLIGSVKSQQIEELMKTGSLSSPEVLWCPSESLQDLVLALKPHVAITNRSLGITSANNLDNKTLSALSKGKTKLFFTGSDGAI